MSRLKASNNLFLVTSFRNASKNLAGGCPLGMSIRIGNLAEIIDLYYLTNIKLKLWLVCVFVCMYVYVHM